MPLQFRAPHESSVLDFKTFPGKVSQTTVCLFGLLLFRFQNPVLMLMSAIFGLVLLVLMASQSAAECNLQAYEQWKDEIYTGELATVNSFWRYQTQSSSFPLKNGLAIQLAVSACVNDFDLLYYYLAGRVGPIDIQHSYKIMCRQVCMASDDLHEAAMAVSGCSCLELSTQPDDDSYHIEGDFCRENTARLLCDKVGYCGIWDCRIDDFMCPRYEWNKKYIPLKGIGSCVRGAASRAAGPSTMVSAAAAIFVAAFLAHGWLV